MRTLAIDHGAKRIGLALSDEGARFATPLDVLANDGATIDAARGYRPGDAPTRLTGR